jgi:hypothetical protein
VKGVILLGAGANYTPTILTPDQQYQYIAGLFPHFNRTIVEQVQTYYNASTFGTLQNATNHMCVQISRDTLC